MTATVHLTNNGLQERSVEAAHMASAVADTRSDLLSATIDCRGWDSIELQLAVSPTGDPVGVLYVQRSIEDVAATFASVAVDANKMDTTDTTAITHTSADYRKIVVNDPAATAYVNLIFTDLPSFLRVFWDVTSGGTATGGLAIKYTLRMRAAKAKD